ncbi:pyridoxamine 5'-phosphate oxidase family protein [Antrihabitans sp. YC2-6]|uniref:pyridoxamine 5'-phosphate oxidase family protein n=1 Tax=Antrihabitans sp. YC2-6 TaxID=2799498 RepID=UPI0018F68EB8|nr:pyridoxamine 5'-phosphate oxidase family protein [Antrihabitans sp. YC2-6]MBJ8347587.1 pyridoxamine 5'-phosphate oxidase family protein [Antrihabitans sp. YC2-6]
MEHPGELAVQARTGVRISPWGSARMDGEIPPVAADFLAQQTMVVLGAAARDGSMWASLLAGPAGFVTAIDDRTVAIDRLPAETDPLAGLFDSEHDIGMIAIDLATRRRMRINGLAHRSDDRLIVRTEQVYANCPKYIQIREPAVELHGTRQAHHGPALTSVQRELIAAADTFFIATHADGAGADVSHRGGNPGFVSVEGERRLSWPDYSGNLMYMTLGNLELDPHCGLLFVDWGNGSALHLTGRAYVDWEPDRAANVPGAQRMVDFDVEQVWQVDGAVPWRWALRDYSRFNPS